MITNKSDKEILLMQEGGKILAAILNRVSDMITPGVSADDLEKLVLNEIKKNKVKSAFLNYDTGYLGKYPAALCVSINDEVVHGLPSDNKIFHDGDLVGIDCGIWYKNLVIDSALTVPCGKIGETARKLLNITKEALQIGISQCIIGNHVGDIGRAIQKYTEANNFKIIKNLVGHGVGYKVHEDPQIPNFLPADHQPNIVRGAELKAGMTLAIEPMITVSSEQTKRGSDGYAAVTDDGSLAAHFEHTVAVTKQGPLILTI